MFSKLKPRYISYKAVSFVIIFCLAFGGVSPFSLAKPPIIGEVPELKFDPPEPTRVVLKNGVIVYLLEDHELPLFSLNLRMKISPSDVPMKMVGAMSFLGTVWRTGGTKSRTPDELNEELDFMPAKVGTGAADELASIYLSCLSKDIDQGLDIFQDVLFNPVFDSKQFSLQKAKLLEGIRRKNDNPVDISRRVFRDIIYGPEHIYAFNATEKIIKKAKRSQLKYLHEKFVVPNNAYLEVWGDFDTDKILKKLEELFAGWEKTDDELPSYDYEIKNPMDGRVFFIKKPGFNQSRIYIGNSGIRRHSPDRFPIGVANYILGGGGSSRLFAEIRSRLGLAYEVASFTTRPTGPGLVGAAAQTKGPTTLKTIRSIQSELDKFIEEPPTKEEMRLAIDSLVNSFIFQFESTRNIVSQKASLELYGYPDDFLKTYTSKLKAVTREDVLRVAKKYYKNENRRIVVVGDTSHFSEKLDQLGPVTEILLEDID